MVSGCGSLVVAAAQRRHADVAGIEVRDGRAHWPPGSVQLVVHRDSPRDPGIGRGVDGDHRHDQDRHVPGLLSPGVDTDEQRVLFQRMVAWLGDSVGGAAVENASGPQQITQAVVVIRFASCVGKRSVLHDERLVTWRRGCPEAV